MSRFRLIPLVRQLRLVTKGNLISAPVYLEIDSPEFRKLLPYCEALTLFSLVENPSSEFRAALYFRAGFDRNNENGVKGPVGALFPATGGSTESKRHADYTQISEFELEGRLLLGYGNNQGAGFESGVVSAVLGMKLVGQ